MITHLATIALFVFYSTIKKFLSMATVLHNMSIRAWSHCFSFMAGLQCFSFTAWLQFFATFPSWHNHNSSQLFLQNMITIIFLQDMIIGIHRISFTGWLQFFTEFPLQPDFSAFPSQHGNSAFPSQHECNAFPCMTTMLHIISFTAWLQFSQLFLHSMTAFLYNFPFTAWLHWIQCLSVTLWLKCSNADDSLIRVPVLHSMNVTFSFTGWSQIYVYLIYILQKRTLSNKHATNYPLSQFHNSWQLMLQKPLIKKGLTPEKTDPILSASALIQCNTMRLLGF